MQVKGAQAAAHTRIVTAAQAFRCLRQCCSTADAFELYSLGLHGMLLALAQLIQPAYMPPCWYKVPRLAASGRCAVSMLMRCRHAFTAGVQLRVPAGPHSPPCAASCTAPSSWPCSAHQPPMRAGSCAQTDCPASQPHQHMKLCQQNPRARYCLGRSMCSCLTKESAQANLWHSFANLASVVSKAGSAARQAEHCCAGSTNTCSMHLHQA